jgi:hypothetical protein
VSILEDDSEYWTSYEFIEDEFDVPTENVKYPSVVAVTAVCWRIWFS